MERKELLDKARWEYDSYLDELRSKSIEEVIESAYETAVKFELKMACEYNALSDDVIRTINRYDYPLHELYYEFLSSELPLDQENLFETMVNFANERIDDEEDASEDGDIDYKAVILERMKKKIDWCKDLPPEMVSDEIGMTIQSVYYNFMKAFEEISIPEHILKIIHEDDSPLNTFYDYFFNDGDVRIGSDWNKICRDYAIYREEEVLEEKLHDKVEVEYRRFMRKVTNMSPYKTGKIIIEIALKMQAFSIVRYQELFTKEDVEALLGTDDILDKMYKKHDGHLLPMDDEHLVWAKAYDYLEGVVRDEKFLNYSEEDLMEP